MTSVVRKCQKKNNIQIALYCCDVNRKQHDDENGEYDIRRWFVFVLRKYTFCFSKTRLPEQRYLFTSPSMIFRAAIKYSYVVRMSSKFQRTFGARRPGSRTTREY